MVVSRRVFLGGTASVIVAGATTPFATPSLALTKEFLTNRGDLRIGLLSPHPPFAFKRLGATDTGLLPTIGKVLSNELWLAPSYTSKEIKDFNALSYKKIFESNGGIDIIFHASLYDAKRFGLLHTSAYIRDEICYISLPDVRNIGLFPTTFKNNKVLAFPDQMVQRFMKHSIDSQELDIDYNVTPEDMTDREPLRRLVRGEIDTFVATRRQLEWLIGDSTHKFHINTVFFPNQISQYEFCVLVNPASAWILPSIEQKLVQMRESFQLQRIFQKYHLN